MNKLICPAFAVLIAISCLTTSCKKYSNSPTGGVITVNNLNKVFADLKTAPQTYSVTAGKYATVQGTKGTIINFYPNSFKDANGNIITSGTVAVQLTEMYKPGDMIRNRTTGTSNGQLLKSGGEININATVNGQQVYANKYSIAFNQPAGSIAAPMQLFYGAYGKTDSLTGWLAADPSANLDSVRLQNANIAVYDSSGTVSWMPDATGSQSYYIFDSCTKFNFTNCDQFYNFGTLATVNVTMPDTSFNPSNTEIYLVMPALNCVLANNDDGGLAGMNYNVATNTFALLSESNTAIAPVGQTYKLIVITLKNGNYYYFETSGTIPASLNATAVMVAKSHSDVMTLLDAL